MRIGLPAPSSGRENNTRGPKHEGAGQDAYRDVHHCRMDGLGITEIIKKLIEMLDHPFSRLT